jgi:hypothetical protein
MAFCFLLLLAQYVPTDFKAELFGGYANLRAEKQAQHGWTATYTDYSLFRRWGLTAEVSQETDTRAYLFGGTFRSIRRPRFALTGRIVAGLTDWNRLPQQTAFTFGFAQSIDWKLNEHWALRVQPGFRFLRLDDPAGGRRTVLATPLALGLVYKFGHR